MALVARGEIDSYFTFALIYVGATQSEDFCLGSEQSYAVF